MLSSKLIFQTIFCWLFFFFYFGRSTCSFLSYLHMRRRVWVMLYFWNIHELCVAFLWNENYQPERKEKKIATKKVSILSLTCWKRNKSQYTGSMSNQHSCPFSNIMNKGIKKKQHNLCTSKHLQDFDSIMKYFFYSFLINTDSWTKDGIWKSGGWANANRNTNMK